MSATPKTITKEDLRIWLVRNKTTLAGLARRMGFEPNTVHVIVFRYLNSDRSPRSGTIGEQILKKLREEIANSPCEQSDAPAQAKTG